MTWRNLLVGCVIAIVAGKKPSVTTLYPTQKSKVQIVEETRSFRVRSNRQNCGLNPVRMNITTETKALVDNHRRRKNKALLLDITIDNPCASSNLENAARHAGKHFADAIDRKKNEYRDSFPASYTLLPLAISTW